MGLAAIPPLALAVGLPGAFFATGLAGMAWAVWGALTLPQSSSSISSRSASKQQQQQQKPKGGVGLGRLLQLPKSTLAQLGVLCYSHAVMGYCFFILQVG